MKGNNMSPKKQDPLERVLSAVSLSLAEADSIDLTNILCGIKIQLMKLTAPKRKRRTAKEIDESKNDESNFEEMNEDSEL
jgi:hypothetical protein